MMKISWMKQFGLAIAILLSGGACSNSANWDWFGMKKKKDDKPVTKARRPSEEPAVATADRPKPAAAKPAEPADPKAKEVGDKVDRYVQSMNKNNYDPNYEGNDFQSKMRRQNDPSRSARIKQTAAATREQSESGADAPAETAKAPAKEKVGEQSAKSEPPAAPTERLASSKTGAARHEDLQIGRAACRE